MDSSNPNESTVLVVDDEPDLTATFVAWLESEYAVREANDAEQARSKLDDEVDVVLLDRRMPGTSGDEFLEEIRASDVSVHVGMLTAVVPNVDVIDMPFDDYAVKPIGREDLLALVESLDRLSTYGDRLQKLYSLAAKRATLLDANRLEELADSPKFAELTRRFEELRRQTDEALHELGEDEYATAFRSVIDGTDD